jgi:hypothetical protein
MKGVHNRQKIVVMPRESVEKRTMSALKIKSKEVVRKRKLGMVTSKFQKNTQ